MNIVTFACSAVMIIVPCTILLKQSCKLPRNSLRAKLYLVLCPIIVVVSVFIVVEIVHHGTKTVVIDSESTMYKLDELQSGAYYAKTTNATIVHLNNSDEKNVRLSLSLFDTSLIPNIPNIEEDHGYIKLYGNVDLEPGEPSLEIVQEKYVLATTSNFWSHFCTSSSVKTGERLIIHTGGKK